MDDLDRPERVKFLALIDKLREIGLGTDISLPQVSPDCKFLDILIKFSIACGCGRSVQWQKLFA